MDFIPDIPTYQIPAEYRQDAEGPDACGPDMRAIPPVQVQAMADALTEFLADPANTAAMGPELQHFLHPPRGKVEFSGTFQTYRHGLWSLRCDRHGAFQWRQRPIKLLSINAILDFQGAAGEWIIHSLQPVFIHPRAAP